VLYGLAAWRTYTLKWHGSSMPSSNHSRVPVLGVVPGVHTGMNLGPSATQQLWLKGCRQHPHDPSA
jgi:hypothetical protein